MKVIFLQSPTWRTSCLFELLIEVWVRSYLQQIYGKDSYIMDPEYCNTDLPGMMEPLMQQGYGYLEIKYFSTEYKVLQKGFHTLYCQPDQKSITEETVFRVPQSLFRTDLPLPASPCIPPEFCNNHLALTALACVKAGHFQGFPLHLYPKSVLFY